MPDVEIGEVATRIEITERSAGNPDDLHRLVEAVLQRLREAQHTDAMRREDDRIRNRSWKSDVKPD